MSSMKQLLTGCYAHLRRYPKELPLVRISWGAPRGWKGQAELGLAWRNFRKWKKGEFTGDNRADYFEQLEQLLKSGELAEILARLPDRGVLLCWEADPGDCHRGWLTEFLRAHKLADIKEVPHDCRVV